MKLKSVCFVGNYVHFSGALQVFRTIARGLKDKGIHTAYLYHKQRPEDVPPDMSMFDEVQLFDDAGVEDMRPLAEQMALFANRFDVVHSSLIPLQWRYRWKAKLHRPHVETYHSADGWDRSWRQYQFRIEGGIEHPPTATVAVSRGLAKRIVSFSGIAARCIYNGVKESEGIAPMGPYLTYCGRCTADKGLAEWIRVAKLAACPGMKFQWIGEPKPTLELEWLKAAWPELEITGYQEDVTPYLSRSFALLLTSPSEGLPLVILEAGMLGVPSIAYESGDVAETGANSPNDKEGEEYKRQCAFQLTQQAFYRWQTEGTERRNALRDKTIATFSARGMVLEYLDLYESLV